MQRNSKPGLLLLFTVVAPASKNTFNMLGNGILNILLLMSVFTFQ